MFRVAVRIMPRQGPDGDAGEQHHERVRKADALRKHYKVAALSNTEKPSVEHFLAHRSNLFEVKVFSCDEGIIKPDGQLFERCVQRLDVEPQEAVLIDDRTENVAGARAVGAEGMNRNLSVFIRRGILAK